MSSKTALEAVLALASVAAGIAGAALVQPIVLGIAAVGAVVATAMKLSHSGHSSIPKIRTRF
jgi:hypothetical protein